MLAFAPISRCIATHPCPFLFLLYLAMSTLKAQHQATAEVQASVLGFDVTRAGSPSGDYRPRERTSLLTELLQRAVATEARAQYRSDDDFSDEDYSDDEFTDAPQHVFFTPLERSSASGSPPIPILSP